MQAQILPNYTVQQRRSGILKGVTFWRMCYSLYSKLPEIALVERKNKNTLGVTERKGEKWITIQKE